MKETINASVLVIDDEEIERDSIEDILVPKSNYKEEDGFSQPEDILFTNEKPLLTSLERCIPLFTVDKASSGMQGLEMVKKSIAENRPYAVIFLDMRMPGWDGLETAIEIRKYDGKAEIIFVTAFSDHSIEDIIAKAGQNVGYHCKPFAPEEIILLATKAVTDYSKLRNLEQLIEVISSISLNEQQLHSLLRNILGQLAGYVDTDMALMGKLNADYTYEKIFSIGAMEEHINLDKLIAQVKAAQIGNEEVVQMDEVVLARVDHYIIFAALKIQEKLKTEKLYLLKLFVQSAAKAIQNAALHEELLQKEKLSAVGKAIGMVIHDLKPPIQYIKILTGLMRNDKVESRWMLAIDQCADQASEIFEDFLDFIREKPILKQPVDLTKVIEKGIQMADEKSGIDKISIIKNLAQGLIVSGDENKLKRIVMNLVGNAIEVLKEQKIPLPCIEISTTKDASGAFVNLCIKDNGPGIPDAILKTVFEPFVTMHKANGTGLGLAIVKQFVLAHGGTVKVENNAGAIFTVTLPVLPVINI
jgi:nitrogen-specific signal transduction histidine kinase/FixJ family two-component response regulator